MMEDMVSISRAELTRLEQRSKRLAEDKAYLQLLIRLMNRISSAQGLESTIDSMLKFIVDVIGATNIILYYRLDHQLFYADVCGKRAQLERIEDPLVQRVFDSRQPLEDQHAFADTQMLTPEFTNAYTWVFPLLVGSELLGAFKMENLSLGVRGFYRHLPTFFQYTALVLKNEISGQTRLQQAYDQLSQANAELTTEIGERRRVEEALRQSKEELELRVRERTAALNEANERLQVELAERKRAAEQIEQQLHELQRWYQVTLAREGRVLALKQEVNGLLRRLGEPARYANHESEGGESAALGENGELPSSDAPVHTLLTESQAARGALLSILEDEKQTEEELRRVNRALHALSDCNQALIHAGDEAELLATVCRIVVERGGYQRAWVAYPEKDEACSLRPVAQAGFEAGVLESLQLAWAETEGGQGPASRAIRSGQPALIRHGEDDPVRAALRARGFQEDMACVLGLPLVTEGTILGALEIYARTADAFDAEEMTLLQEMAADLAFGIAARRARQARQEAETALHLFRQLTNQSHDAIFVLEPQTGRLLDSNDTAARTLGYSREELLSMRVVDIDPVMRDPSQWAAHLEAVRSAGAVTQESLHQRKDGMTFPVEVSVSYVVQGRADYLIAVVRDITERKRMEQELAWLASFPLRNPQPVVEVDLQGRITFANPTAQRLFPDLEQRGRHHPWLADWETLAAAYRDQGTLPEGREVTVAGRVYHQVLYVMSQEHRLRIYGFEITRRKEVEKALRRELEINRAMSELSRVLISRSSSIRDVADTTLEYARALTGSEHGFVSVLDPHNGDNVGVTLTAMMEGECQLAGEDGRIVFPLGPDGRYAKLWGQALNSREAFYTNAPATHPAAGGTPSGHIPLRNFLAVPALVKEKLVGEVALANAPRDYTDDDLNVVARLASLYATALDRAETENTLRESEERWRTLLQTVDVGVIVHDPQTRVVACNATALAALELSASAVLGLTEFQMLTQTHGGAWPYVQEGGTPITHNCFPVARVVATGQAVRGLVLGVLRPERPPTWILLHADPVRNGDGTLREVIVVFMDITERKQAEETLRRSSQEVHDLYDHAPCGYHSLNGDGVFVRINDTELQWLGYTRDEIVDRKKFPDLITPKSRELFHEVFPRFQEQGWVKDLEFEIVRKDGTLLPVLLNATAVYDAAGKFLMSRSTIYDVTERKRAELAQQRLNRELRAISNCNQVLMRAVDEPTLLKDVCHIICEEAGYGMAWVGYAEHDAAKTVRPVAWAGRDSEYIATAGLSWADDTERGCGPAGVAIRSGEIVYVQDFRSDPRMAPWRESVLQHGYRSGIALPLRDDHGRIFGVLLIYSSELNAITPDEIRLLEELAGDLAFGITILRARGERKRAEKELQRYKEHLEDLVGQRTAELEVAKEAAEAANRAKSVFLANMSHELRTPLSAVLGFSSLLRNAPDASEEQRKLLEIINRSGEHLLGLINDVLDVAKIEAGRIRVENEPFDLGDLLRSITDMMRVRAAEKGLLLAIDQASHFPRFIQSDPAKLRQVLINLLGNAIKYTPAGSVTVRLRATPGAADGDQQRLRLHIEVEDTGIGIAAEDQQRIFDPFVQIGKPSGQKGSGLGLTITRQYVELMGGTIAVHSTPGQGSCFAVELPVIHAEGTETLVTMVDRGRVIGLVPGQPEYRILIVEDEPDNRLLLEQLLEPLGFPVRTAENGRAGVALFQEWHPHFIWMDRRMPEMDGLEATRQIRVMEGGWEVKIVAVTASVFREQRRDVLAAGLDDMVSKPFRPAEIYDCLARHLGVRYLYAEEVAETPAAPLCPEMLAALPAALRQELVEALICLDTARIDAAIAQVSREDAALGQVLAQHAERLAFAPLLRALETSLVSSSEA